MSKDWSEFDKLTDEYLAKPLPIKWSIQGLAEIVRRSESGHRLFQPALSGHVFEAASDSRSFDSQLTPYLEIYKID